MSRIFLECSIKIFWNFWNVVLFWFIYDFSEHMIWYLAFLKAFSAFCVIYGSFQNIPKSFNNVLKALEIFGLLYGFQSLQNIPWNILEFLQAFLKLLDNSKAFQNVLGAYTVFSKFLELYKIPKYFETLQISLNLFCSVANML